MEVATTYLRRNQENSKLVFETNVSIIVKLISCAVQYYYSSAVANVIWTDVMKVDSSTSKALTFTDRQLKVIHLLLQGKSNKQIALQLGTCTRTVEEHLTHIYQKLKISCRAEAIIKLIHLSEKSQSSGTRS